MQIKKDNTEEKILKSAEKMFLKNGFTETSMRDIASDSGIGLSNIYNYFKNKDEIFCKIVNPVVSKFEDMLNEHYGKEVEKMMCLDHLVKDIKEYAELILNNREQMELLLLKAQGTSLQYFKEYYTNKTTEQVKSWLASLKKDYPEINTDITEFSIHLRTVWLFSFIEELVMHNVNKDKMSKIIDEYLAVETAGWGNLMKLKISNND